MNPQEIIHNALNNIQINANIKGKWKDIQVKSRIDGELKLEIENHTIRLFTDIKTEVRTIHLEKIEELAKEYHSFIVVAQRIFPKIKDELRN
jgi:hypothetical protein